MDKSEAANLLKEIKANHAKLNSCSKHEFGKVIGDRTNGYSTRQNMRTCSRCDGKMDDSQIILYAKGYKAAGGNPDDIGQFIDGESLA